MVLNLKQRLMHSDQSQIICTLTLHWIFNLIFVIAAKMFLKASET